MTAAIACEITRTTSRTGNTTSYGYDLAGRRTSVTNSLGAVTGYAYDDGGNLDHTADALSQTNWYDYDLMNRLIHSTFPDGRVSTNTYEELGRLIARTGAGSVPAFYAYDPLSRLTNLIDGVSNQTHFAYDSMSRLTQKTYADSSFYGYAYSSRGWLTNRLDPKGIATGYSYNNVGQLTKVDYASDIDVLYSFDILGRMTQRVDTAGVWTWSYDGESSRVLSESLFASSACFVVASSYSSNTFDLASVSFGPCTTLYSWASGRLVAVTSVVEGASQAFTYAYKANSDLLETTSYLGPTVTVTRAYDLLDRLTSISASNHLPSAINHFSYELDSSGRRTKRTHADASSIAWKYDFMDQLTNAVMTDTNDAAFAASYKYGYEYDLVGNRLHEDRGQLDLDGTFNPLNQLTYLDWGGKYDILGTVDQTGSVVLVQGVTSAPPFYNLTNFLGGAAVNNPGSNSIPIVVWQGTNSTQTNMIVYMPPVKPQEFKWDANGNLTNSGDTVFSWNEENKLVAIESGAGVSPADRKRSEFVYDAQSRMVERKDFSGWNGSSYATTNLTQYVRDGYRIVAEIQSGTGVSPVTNYYVWGLDLSQSLDGAGGIGGLLARISGTNVWYYTYDGNGNVTDVLDANGVAIAHYEYDPFGRVVAKSGWAADLNPWQFSTKLYDPIWGIILFEWRPYSPQWHIFLSRDVIRETTEPYRYLFTGNSPANSIDVWGMCRCVSAKITFNPGGDEFHLASVPVPWDREALDQAFYRIGNDIKIQFVTDPQGAEMCSCWIEEEGRAQRSWQSGPNKGAVETRYQPEHREEIDCAEGAEDTLGFFFLPEHRGFLPAKVKIWFHLIKYEAHCECDGSTAVDKKNNLQRTGTFDVPEFPQNVPKP